MNILLSGIIEKDKNLMKKQIEDMVSTIFKDGLSNVTEINIPDDFKSTVNSIHKEKYPDELYFVEGEKNNLKGKTFNYEDGIRILLNKDLQNGIILSTLYHELIHSKYYSDIKNYNYLKYDPCDRIEGFSFYFIDEYNAYKKTFIKYNEVLEEYAGYVYDSIYLCKDIGEYNHIINQLNIFNKHMITDFDKYMYRVVAKLSIAMAILDVLTEIENKDMFGAYMKHFYGKQMEFIINYLHTFVNSINNNIPAEYEFNKLKQCIYDISCFYNMYSDNEE